jgi:hypothetical protein
VSVELTFAAAFAMIEKWQQKKKHHGNLFSPPFGWRLS